MLAGAAAGFLVLGAGQPAPSVGAQSPIETDPAEGEELSAPPTEIFLRFEEAVGDAQISMGCNGNPFTSIENPPSVSDDGLTVTAALLSPPPAGDCTVAWSTTLPTGEAGQDGSFAFELLASPVTTPGQTTEPSDTTETTVPADDEDEVVEEDDIRDASEVSDGAIWLGQVLSTFGVAVLFGVARADRRGVAGGAGVPARRAFPALRVGARPGRDVALRRRPQRRRARRIVRQRPQPWRLARPVRRRGGWAGRAGPAGARDRQRVGRAAARTGHRPDDPAARHRHPDPRRRDARLVAHGR